MCLPLSGILLLDLILIHLKSASINTNLFIEPLNMEWQASRKVILREKGCVYVRLLIVFELC